MYVCLTVAVIGAYCYLCPPIMIEVRTKDDCIGCGTCVDRCPRRCISMRDDGSGWIRPVVNTDFCIMCGICENVCPVLIDKALKSGHYFLHEEEHEQKEAPTDELPDMRGLIFEEFGMPIPHGVENRGRERVFRAGDCVLVLSVAGHDGRLFKVYDGGDKHLAELLAEEKVF